MASTQLPVIWTPEYEADIGPHVFPTVKYRLVKDRLLEEGTIAPEAIHRPRPAPRADLERVHTTEYLDRIETGRLSPSEERILEVPFSAELRQAFLLCCGGTTLACRWALDAGVAAHLGGGFHHAFPGHGEGFCLLNDVAVGVRTLMAEGMVERAAVVDLDVHHGNGTAVVFQDDPDVFTFSMHQERNYPSPKPPGDLDVGLDDGIGDDRYLDILRKHLPTVLDGHAPGLVVYLAGADPFREDQLGGLALSVEGLAERDALVLRACRERGVPVATTLAGGYAVRLADTVAIHANTVRQARQALDPAP